MFGVFGMATTQDLVIYVYSHCHVIENNKTKCINLNKLSVNLNNMKINDDNHTLTFSTTTLLKSSLK